MQGLSLLHSFGLALSATVEGGALRHVHASVLQGAVLSGQKQREQRNSQPGSHPRWLQAEAPRRLHCR